MRQGGPARRTCPGCLKDFNSRYLGTHQRVSCPGRPVEEDEDDISLGEDDDDEIEDGQDEVDGVTLAAVLQDVADLEESVFVQNQSRRSKRPVASTSSSSPSPSSRPPPRQRYRQTRRVNNESEPVNDTNVVIPPPLSPATVVVPINHMTLGPPLQLREVSPEPNPGLLKHNFKFSTYSLQVMT